MGSEFQREHCYLEELAAQGNSFAKKCANAVLWKVVNKYLGLLFETFAQWYLQAGFTCASVCLGAGNCEKKEQHVTTQSKQLREQILNT